MWLPTAAAATAPAEVGADGADDEEEEAGEQDEQGAGAARAAVAFAPPAEREAGDFAGPGAAPQPLFGGAGEVSAAYDAVLRAERARAAANGSNGGGGEAEEAGGGTGTRERHGGVGAGGRYTSFAELAAALDECAVGEAVQRSVLARVAGSAPGSGGAARSAAAGDDADSDADSDADGDDELSLSWMQSLDYWSSAPTLRLAIEEARRRRLPLVAAVLCLDEHDGHASASTLFWRNTLSNKQVARLLRTRFVCWAAAVQGRSHCAELHALLPVHSVPVVLTILAAPDGDGSSALVDCFAGALDRSDALRRLEETLDVYEPLLRMGTHSAVPLHFAPDASPLASHDDATLFGDVDAAMEESHLRVRERQ